MWCGKSNFGGYYCTRLSDMNDFECRKSPGVCCRCRFGRVWFNDNQPHTLVQTDIPYHSVFVIFIVWPWYLTFWSSPMLLVIIMTLYRLLITTTTLFKKNSNAILQPTHTHTHLYTLGLRNLNCILQPILLIQSKIPASKKK